jgi:hypothetical protein
VYEEEQVEYMSMNDRKKFKVDFEKNCPTTSPPMIDQLLGENKRRCKKRKRLEI